jgi:hypothetical protein
MIHIRQGLVPFQEDVAFHSPSLPLAGAFLTRIRNTPRVMEVEKLLG